MSCCASRASATYVVRAVIVATSNITDVDYFTNSLLFKFSKVYILSTYGVLGFWGFGVLGASFGQFSSNGIFFHHGLMFAMGLGF